MLVKIGRSPAKSGDLVDMLRACHARIRSFTALALAAARQEARAEREIAEACSAVELYMREALPLHVQDEEQSILPRLRGQAPELDAALATMQREHAEHEPKLAELLAACAALRSQPRDPPARARLEAAATELAVDFERHLTLEEQLMFQAVARLSPATQGAIIVELRERRQRALFRRAGR